MMISEGSNFQLYTSVLSATKGVNQQVNFLSSTIQTFLIQTIESYMSFYIKVLVFQ